MALVGNPTLGTQVKAKDLVAWRPYYVKLYDGRFFCGRYVGAKDGELAFYDLQDDTRRVALDTSPLFEHPAGETYDTPSASPSDLAIVLMPHSLAE